MSRPSGFRSRAEPESDSWRITLSAAALSRKAKELPCGLPTVHQFKSAYSDNNRDVRVGSGLRGLHHAKSILLEAPSGPELVAGSLNFTTSSKANAELGVKFSLPAGSNAAATWLSAFEAVWAESTSVEDAAERAPRAAPRSKATSSQKTATGS